MTLADREPGCEAVHSAVVEHAIGNQTHGSAHEIAAGVPVPGAGKCLRTATLARPESGGHCGSSARKVLAVVRQRGPRRARGATVDAGGDHPEVEPTVPPGVASGDRAVGGFWLEGEMHLTIVRPSDPEN